MTDQELITGIINRNPSALEKVVKTNQELVIRTCYALVHDLAEAEDLAQDVFIEIMRSAKTFRGKARLSSWIYRIAVNKSLNHLKRLKRREVISLFASRGDGNAGTASREIPDATHARGDEVVEQKELRKALHLAIDKLPANQRIAFTLHNYEELTYKEVAEVMEVSLSSVESLIHRAKINLRKFLSRYYDYERKQGSGD